VPTSKRVTLFFNCARSPDKYKTPAQRVTRKMFEPAVLAITIPFSPREAEKMEMSFSGRVVAKERMVMPAIVVFRDNKVERVVTLWERI